LFSFERTLIENLHGPIFQTPGVRGKLSGMSALTRSGSPENLKTKKELE
jgi:hypothetical protein